MYINTYVHAHIHTYVHVYIIYLIAVTQARVPDMHTQCPQALPARGNCAHISGDARVPVLQLLCMYICYTFSTLKFSLTW